MQGIPGTSTRFENSASVAPVLTPEGRMILLLPAGVKSASSRGTYARLCNSTSASCGSASLLALATGNSVGTSL